MALQMTKKEYEAKYGVSPYFSKTTDIDVSVAPVRMTQEEFDAKYKTKEPEKGGILGPAKEAIGGLKTLFGVSEQGIASKLSQDVMEGAKDMGKGNVLKGGAKAFLRTAGDVGGLIFAPIGAALQATGFNKLIDYTAEKIVKSDYSPLKPTFEALQNNPTFQDYAIKHPNAEEDINRALMLLMAGLDRSPINAKTAIPRTIEQVKTGVKTGLETVRQIPTKVSEFKNERATKKIESEIANIENNYIKTQKSNQYEKDLGSASRERIAKTDVLANLVNEEGKITIPSAKAAANAYAKISLDGTEGVVRDLLIREGKKINLGEVAKELTTQVYRSGLEGTALIKAVNGLKAELDGLRLRADELGNIELSKIHDAKISTSKNINYKTDSTPTIIYRKAKASAYKNLVQNKSNVELEVGGKKYKIEAINKVLGEFLGDVERIENLGGKMVKGGKLGKYSAQITGNLAGMAVGSPFGPAGMAVSTVVGGEVASYLKGKMMAKTFGKGTGGEPIKNAILERAKAEGKLPPEVNLKIPDVKLGVPKGIPKTKEILKIERDIAKNVEQQKTAIKAGNFALVATLKEIYQVLVQTLKDIITRIKNTPNKEGGFVDLTYSTNRGSSKVGSQLGKEIKGKVPYSDATTMAGISKDLQPLAQEARKYKSAEEFVKAQGGITVERYAPKGDTFNKEKGKFFFEEGESINQLAMDKNLIRQDEVIFPKKVYETIDQETAIKENFGFLEATKLLDKIKSIDKDLLKGKITFDEFISSDGGFHNLDVAIANKLKEKGYDAIHYLGADGDLAIDQTFKNQWVALDPSIIKTKSQLINFYNQVVGGKNLAQKIIQTGEQKPTIKLKRDVTAKLLNGEKVKIPEDEILKAYESGGKILLKDGREYIVSKSQYENIKNNSLKSEAKEFAPELKGTEETILRNENPETFDEWGNEGGLADNSNSGGMAKYSSYQLPGGKNYKEVLIKAPGGKVPMTLDQLSNKQFGKDFRELTVQQKTMIENQDNFQIKQNQGSFKSSHWDEPNVISHLRLNERTYKGKKVTFMEELQSDWAREGRSKGFANPLEKGELPQGWKVKSGLKWDKTGNGDFITDVFQRDLRITKEGNSYIALEDNKPLGTGRGWRTPEQAQKFAEEYVDKKWQVYTPEGERIGLAQKTQEQAISEAKQTGFFGKSQVPNNPLLKNWQELSVKRALKEAVDNNSEYLAWTTGEQQAARYNLSTQLNEVKWNESSWKGTDTKAVTIVKKEGGSIDIEVTKDGTIEAVWEKKIHPLETNIDWKGKKLDQVIGKGLAEQIMKDTEGNLSGEGLNIGGEWAKNLYDKQVKNIVEDLTGHKVEVIDMGIKGEKVEDWYSKEQASKANAIPLKPGDLKVGEEVFKNSLNGGSDGRYIITDILGDGKFKAVPKKFTYNGVQWDKGEMTNKIAEKEAWQNHLKTRIESFDISTKKSTGQQAIKITPEIKALVKGEKLKLK